MKSHTSDKHNVSHMHFHDIFNEKAIECSAGFRYRISAPSWMPNSLRRWKFGDSHYNLIKPHARLNCTSSASHLWESNKNKKHVSSGWEKYDH
jgi:hypothetical protein